MTAVDSGRRRGRPTVVDERHADIVRAFIELVGARGLEATTLDDVARAAGVQRAAVRHFVGNRSQLITAAVVELCARYEREVRSTGGAKPRFEQLAKLLFSERWIGEQSTDDLAFNTLLHEASRDEQVRDAFKAVYDATILEISAALRRSYPGASVDAIRDTAYAITCLSEHNSTMQSLGFPRARSTALLKMSLRLADELDTEPHPSGVRRPRGERHGAGRGAAQTRPPRKP